MTDSDWQAVYESLEMEFWPGYERVELPTESAIADVEKQFGIVLPESYRRMVKIFGPGELGGRFMLKAPGYAEQRPKIDLFSFTEKWRSILPENSSDERVGRLIYFCDTIYSDFIGWDPTDVRDSKSRELGIYICVHERDRADFLTDSFDKFINDFCFGDGLGRFLEGEGHAGDRSADVHGCRSPVRQQQAHHA